MAASDSALDPLLRIAGPLAAGWGGAIEAAGRGARSRAERLGARYGAALGVSAPDIAWALGQAVSRSYGSGPDAALLPYIDLINHDRHAARPAAWQAVDGSGAPAAAIFAAGAAGERQGGGGGGQTEPGGLAAGAELCVSYIADTAPLTMFLNFGFVPGEHRT